MTLIVDEDKAIEYDRVLANYCVCRPACIIDWQILCRIRSLSPYLSARYLATDAFPLMVFPALLISRYGRTPYCVPAVQYEASIVQLLCYI